MIQGAPRDVLAAQRLACSTCVLVNVGVNRDDLSKSHMTYVYDEDLCFTRLNFPHMFSPNNAPNGSGSIQAEVYFSEKYKPLTGVPEDWIEPVIRDLRRMGLLREEDQIVFRGARLLRYANIILTWRGLTHSRRCTAIWMIWASPTAGATETGAICGQTRASRAESRLRKRRYRR